jgi:chloramphenicol-sensitive protein RarD
MPDHRKGYLQAITAYALWGVFPIYWKLLRDVPAIEVICHRILWSLLTLLLFTTYFRQWDTVLELIRDKQRMALCTLAATLISINWLVFIWAVQFDYVVESSLGYFITPLFTVLLAVILYQETISGLQSLSILLAFVGVAIMTWTTGAFPWIALSLAVSFALYGAVKKRTTMPAVSGLGMETAILAPLAMLTLVYFQWTETSRSFHTTRSFILLVLGGPITTLPLVLFASAAKSVPMVAIGMLQYIGPTLQFLFAYFLFHEEITLGRFVGFVFVWIALGIFVWGTVLIERSKRASISLNDS